jgi:formylglycine-generating enzyme required for sulfatase activity
MFLERDANGFCCETMGPKPKASWNHLGFAQSEDDPVVCITFTDVQDYITWIGKKTKKTYRLLSEAEWEYATRAGTTTPYPWGTVASHQYANYGADSGYAGLALGKDKWMYTSPVGSFPPNAFGLYDMIGNVNQYLEDYFSGSYEWLADDGTAYKKIVELKSLTGDFSSLNGTSSSDYRMVRGANFGDPPAVLRCAYRNFSPGPGADLKHYASAGLGFRVARSL